MFPWTRRKRDEAEEAAAAIGEPAAETRLRLRLLDEMKDADRSLWTWFPPVFVIAFGLLSFAGTYIGLSDIIATGDLRFGVFGDVLVFVLVALATGAMVFFLRRATINFLSLGGLAALAAYLGLAFFSVTFGFAFYWGRLEASGQAIQGAQTRIERFSDEIQIGALTLRATADSLTRLSEDFRALAVTERLQGGTCGDGSGAGAGPRMRHRERRAGEIETRVAEIQPRFAAALGPAAILEAELEKIEALRDPERLGDADPGAAREAQFQESRRAARAAAVEINALAADPALIALGAEFKRWGAEYQDPGLVRRDDPRGVAYRCIEAAAGRQLEAAGERLANLPRVAAPDLPDFVGAEATREAVFRMLESAGGAGAAAVAAPAALLRIFTPAPEDPPQGSGPQGSGPQGRAPLGGPQAGGASPNAAGAATAGGLTAQDRFPLAVAIIIDALLFAFVLIERPGGRYFDRMRRRVNEAAREAFNPMRMVELRQALDEDPDWSLLNRYRFDVAERTFIALPTEAWSDRRGDGLIELDPRSRSAAQQDAYEWDEEGRVEILALRDVLKIFHRNGVVRPVQDAQLSRRAAEEASGEAKRGLDAPGAAGPRHGEPETRLTALMVEAGRRDLWEDWARFDFYEFTPAGFERLLLSGMTRSAHFGERRAPARAPRQGRRDDDDAASLRAAE